MGAFNETLPHSGEGFENRENLISPPSERLKRTKGRNDFQGGDEGILKEGGNQESRGLNGRERRPGTNRERKRVAKKGEEPLTQKRQAPSLWIRRKKRRPKWDVTRVNIKENIRKTGPLKGVMDNFSGGPTKRTRVKPQAKLTILAARHGGMEENHKEKVKKEHNERRPRRNHLMDGQRGESRINKETKTKCGPKRDSDWRALGKPTTKTTQKRKVTGKSPEKRETRRDEQRSPRSRKIGISSDRERDRTEEGPAQTTVQSRILDGAER